MGRIHMKDDDTYRISVSDFTDMAIPFVIDRGYVPNKNTAYHINYMNSQITSLKNIIHGKIDSKTVNISPEVLSSLTGIHRRSISFQPEILSAFYVSSDYFFYLMNE
mgnify:CR=1 FL=1